MPFVIPVIAAFATGAVGAVVAGTATFAAYATVASAVLAVAGAVTGNKDLQRVGAIVGIVGGAASLIGGAEGATTAAAGAAEDGASSGLSGMDIAADAPASSSVANASLAEQAQQADLIRTSSGADGESLADQAARGAEQATKVPDPVNAGVSTDLAQTAPPDQSLMERAIGATGGSSVQPTTAIQPAPNAPGSYAVDSVGQQYNAGDLQAWFSKASNAAGKVGKFVKENKELISLGGDILKSVYNPSSEALEYQKSLMDRAYRNYNSPVVLGQVKKG